MHKLNVDKKYYIMETFNDQAKPINIQCELWKNLTPYRICQTQRPVFHLNYNAR